MQLWQKALAMLMGVTALLAVAAAQAGATVVYAMPDTDRARTDLAVLLVPESLDLELVDGLTYPGFKSMFRRGESQVYIAPGQREIAVRYNMFFQTTVNDHDVVKSKIIVLTFVAEPGKTYRATHAKFRNAQEARAGTENFVVQVTDTDGVNRVLAAKQVQKNWLGESTVATRSDLVSATAVAAATAALPAAAAAVPVTTTAAPATVPAAAMPATAVAPVAAAPQAPASPAPMAGGLKAGDLLKFSWQNASAAERAAFLDWVKANP